MKEFGGPVLFLDRNDINTDEIIPAKYLTEITKAALKPHMLEDLKLEGLDLASRTVRNAKTIVTRKNFGCGSSREHAVWVIEENGINVVIAESFARIFRQNMFNCGLLAIELPAGDIEAIFSLGPELSIAINIEQGKIVADDADHTSIAFTLSGFDRDLVKAGGWLAYAEKKY